MALPIAIGDNPQYPYASSETYIPDQLIAGNLKLVTDNATITGTGPLRRGTLLGLTGLGSVVASAGKTPAANTALMATLPVAGDTLTIAGTPITFVAANPNPALNQVMIGGNGMGGFPVTPPTIAGTLNALMALLVGSADVNLSKFTYSLAGSTVTMTAVAYGVAGNALTLATSNPAAFTLGGATASGGTANTGAETISGITAGSRLKTGQYIIALTSTTAANVTDPSGVSLPPAVVGTPYVDPQIGFTINTGAGIAAGDLFILAAAPGTGAYTIATAAAVDGSREPVAVLVDDADPTLGPVAGGVYLMGEFNTNAMTFGAGISVAAAKLTLAPRGIFLKGAVTANDPT